MKITIRCIFNRSYIVDYLILEILISSRANPMGCRALPTPRGAGVCGGQSVFRLMGSSPISRQRAPQCQVRLLPPAPTVLQLLNDNNSMFIFNERPVQLPYQKALLYKSFIRNDHFK